jgi:ElaB/YqjD/DUF883 family membrane-anchored ribosome-binding protein
MRTKSNIVESEVQGRNAVPAPSVIAASNSAPSRASVYSFLTDIEGLIKATTSLTGEDLERARAKLNARVTAAKESVEEVSSAIADQVRDTAKITNGYVHARPWQAIGIGAVLGLLLGFAFARRD